MLSKLNLSRILLGTSISLMFFCNNVLAISLDDLMSGSQNSQPQKSSGSILDNVEKARSQKKKEDAFKQYQSEKSRFADICSCLNDNCKSQWHIGPWTYHYESLKSQYDRGLGEFRTKCTHRDKISHNTSAQEISETASKYKNLNDQLSDTSSSIWNNNFFSKSKYEKDMDEQKAAEYRERLRAEQAAWDAEVESAWDDDSFGMSDNEFWQGINNTHNNTMNNIRHIEDRARQERAAEKRRKAEQEAAKWNNQKTTQNTKSTNYTSQKMNPKNKIIDAQIELSRKQCLNAGGKWNAGGNNCIHTQNINHPGYAYTCDSSNITEAWEGQCKSQNNKTASNENRTTDNILSDLRGSQKSNQSSSNSKTNSPNGIDKSHQNKTKKPCADGQLGTCMKPIFIKEFENPVGWSTEKEACKYAKAAAVRKAEAECKEQFDGRKAYKSEIYIPVESSCPSCRKIEKSGFGVEIIEYKCKANVTLQCKLPE